MPESLLHQKTSYRSFPNVSQRNRKETVAEQEPNMTPISHPFSARFMEAGKTPAVEHNNERAQSQETMILGLDENARDAQLP